MKTLKLKLVLGAALSIVVWMTTVTTTAFAQCAACVSCDGCLICEGPLGLARSCGSTSCDACWEIGGCDVGGIATNDDSPWIVLTESDLSKIAKVHPRFAASLALMNKNGGLTNVQRVNWMTAKITALDVGRLIAAEDYKSVIKQWGTGTPPSQRARSAHRILAYTPQPDGDDAVINIWAENRHPSDPSEAFMSINLKKENGKDAGDKRWRVVNWTVRSYPDEQTLSRFQSKCYKKPLTCGPTKSN